MDHRQERAQVIRQQGYCEGCGCKVKRRLAERHAIMCGAAHMNHAPLPPSESLLLPTERLP